MGLDDLGRPSIFAAREAHIMIRALFLTLAGSLLLAGPAAAGDAKKKDGKLAFSHLDKNKDGFISLEEFRDSALGKKAKNPEKAFKRIDTNGDRKISPEELAAAVKARKSKVK
jgi:Ca2+-binding EF-hand superfamily protein